MASLGRALPIQPAQQPSVGDPFARLGATPGVGMGTCLFVFWQRSIGRNDIWVPLTCHDLINLLQFHLSPAPAQVQPQESRASSMTNDPFGGLF